MRTRRQYSDGLKSVAVRMMLNGTNVLYRWKAKRLTASGPVATASKPQPAATEEEASAVAVSPPPHSAAVHTRHMVPEK